jgi:hypothetical protein
MKRLPTPPKPSPYLDWESRRKFAFETFRSIKAPGAEQMIGWALMVQGDYNSDATIPCMAANITDPSYISEHMLDKVIREKFQENTDDRSVSLQAAVLLRIFRAGKTHDQTIVDILHASRASRRETEEGLAEIAFVMGMQFGFELALTFPPLEKQ